MWYLRRGAIKLELFLRETLTKEKRGYMKKKPELPKFKDEDDERMFWDRIDLKPTSRFISIRIPEYILNRLKEKANEINIPYQSLVKSYIKNGLFV